MGDAGVIEVAVDCERCVAPCCRGFYVWDSETGEKRDEPEEFKSAGAESGWSPLLFVISETEDGWKMFGCNALEDNRCAIYEHRPGTCKTYDCRTDEGRYRHGDDAVPQCEMRELA